MAYREKMSREMRAKQFMPFSALKGYEEALRARERRPAPRKELTEEYLEGLDRKLRQIRKGDRVEVVFYAEGRYRKTAGTVSAVMPGAGLLQVDERKIPAGDICGLRKISG